MDQHLYKYLVLHRQLSIPQLGSFELQADAAHLDENTGLLHGPVERMIFNDGVVHASEQQFYDFLTAETGQDERSVIKQFHEYAYLLRDALVQQHWVRINGIGKLIRHTDGTHQFEPVHDLSGWLPPLQVASPLEPVEATVQKDYWWFYALLLTILGMGALLYYYL
jgi:hypothetical protein